MLIATDASNRPVFDNSAEPDLVVWTMERGFRRNHQFINLEFVNTKLVIDKAEVKVKGCKFSGGKPESAGSKYAAIESPPVTNYIVFQPERGAKEAKGDISVTNGGEVSGCNFLRSSGFNGLGIEVRRYNLDNDAPNMGYGRKLRPKNTLIEYNVFGGSDPSLDGYFVTAINDGGDNTTIRHNTIRRFVDVRAASSDKTIVDAAKADQDHGIYSEGAINSKYLGNVIAGWMPEAAGGAFKLDGSQGIELFDNWMATSGILMYSDMNTKNPVPLRDIYIRSNKIYLDHTNISPLHSYDLSVIQAGQQPGGIYRGIGLWIKNPVNYDDDRFVKGASQPDDLSDYSPPEGAGTSIRIESTEVWGPHGLIYFKAHDYADTSAIGKPSDLYLGSGGVFDSLACEIVDQWSVGSVVSVQNSRSLYNDDFATDCALPNPIVECPEPPSLPPQPPPLVRPPAQCIVDPEDGAKVCIALPPGQDVNDDTDVVAQAWIQRVLKIDYATRYRLPQAGVY